MFFELPAERIEQSCREHLAILDAVDNGDLDWAEALLRQHLKQAWEWRGYGWARLTPRLT